MASLQTSNLMCCSSSSKTLVNAAIHVPKLAKVPFSLPKMPKTAPKLAEELGDIKGTIPIKKNTTSSCDDFKATFQTHAILEAIADRIEMHKNIGEQRDNWNNLLLNSINMITLAATTMAGAAAATGGDLDAPFLALKLTSTLLLSTATGMSLVINKIQPSQLAEEQRNATRLFKQLQSQIQSTLSLKRPSKDDVNEAIEKVLALDKAYPLPLLGAMLEKFPQKYEPGVWWPSATQFQRKKELQERIKTGSTNGWSEELEMELREIIQVIKRKDLEDYERLGNLVLKMNKILAISGPLLTGIAAMGSAFMGNGSWGAIVTVVAGALAAAINSFEHGGQVGMVFEMYRNCGGFFKQLENSIEATLNEEDLEERENGELFEMKVALQLGRSVSELRQLAAKSVGNRIEGSYMDEFASKLF